MRGFFKILDPFIFNTCHLAHIIDCKNNWCILCIFKLLNNILTKTPTYCFLKVYGKHWTRLSSKKSWLARRWRPPRPCWSRSRKRFRPIGLPSSAKMNFWPKSSDWKVSSVKNLEKTKLKKLRKGKSQFSTVISFGMSFNFFLNSNSIWKNIRITN